MDADRWSLSLMLMWTFATETLRHRAQILNGPVRQDGQCLHESVAISCRCRHQHWTVSVYKIVLSK
jgi:hypothetical protein